MYFLNRRYIMKQDDAFNQESLLNQEECEILETFEADQFTSLNADELSRHQTYAKNTLKKDKSGFKYVNGYLKEL